MDAAGRVVLVAVDLGTHHGDAILAALELEGANPKSEIHLLSVLDPRTLSVWDEKSVLAQEEEYLAAIPGIVEERVRRLVLTHARAQPRARIVGHAGVGPIVPTILQACVDYDADVLICATHGRTGVSRAFLGSTAESLVRRARCPVLVARRKCYEGLSRTPAPEPRPLHGEPTPRALVSRIESLVPSTTIDGWNPASAGPTGIRTL